MKKIKIFSINLVIFLISILIIELLFGGWFQSDNLGAYFREHRMKKVPYSIKYNGEIYNFSYLRNYHGFIGEEISPKKIEAVLIGGSTADERWKPRKFSIAEQLNKKLKADGLNLKIVNSGIEGQSTVGYIANFKFWYSKLENFKPKYFIFYTGINELLKTDYDQWDFSDGGAKLVEKDEKKRFEDNVKSKSFFLDSIRRIKHKYYTSRKTNFMDLDKPYLPPKEVKIKKYDYLKFKEAYEIENMEDLLKKNKDPISSYLNNIDLLVNYTKEYSAKAIIINQVTAYGGHNKYHVALNYALRNHCKKKKYNCIDLATNFQGKEDFWYDWIHTTPKGSEVISNSIYPELLKFIKGK